MFAVKSIPLSDKHSKYSQPASQHLTDNTAKKKKTELQLPLPKYDDDDDDDNKGFNT